MQISSNGFSIPIVILWGDCMNITVKLYRYNGETERVDKSQMLTGEKTYSGNHVDFRDSVDLHAPQFIINETVSAVYNYCVITVDGVTRYYFARVVNVRTGLSAIICDIDVLMSFDVSVVPVIPYRSQSDYNRYIIDTTQPVDVRTEHFNLLFNGANLDYNNMSLIAGIVGTGGTPTDN